MFWQNPERALAEKIDKLVQNNVLKTNEENMKKILDTL